MVVPIRSTRTLGALFIVLQIDKVFALRIARFKPRRERHLEEAICSPITLDVCIAAEMTGFLVQSGFAGLGGLKF